MEFQDRLVEGVWTHSFCGTCVDVVALVTDADYTGATSYEEGTYLKFLSSCIITIWRMNGCWSSPIKSAPTEARYSRQLPVSVGHPAVQITIYAEDKGIDLIVIGHRGKTFLERWVIVSVAKNLMSYALCSVMAVR